jgi:putative hydrolase of the HAD superfamily
MPAGWQNYLFDLYGTLIDIATDESSPAFWRKAANLFAGRYPPEQLRREYRRLVREEWEKRQKGSGYRYPEIELPLVFARLLQPEASGSEVAALAGSPQVAAIARQFRLASRVRFRLMPHAGEVLATLKKQGKGVYLLSNAQRCFTADELAESGLADRFDAVYLSSDWGMSKPQPQFIGQLLEDQRLSAKDCVMVGNDFFSDMGSAAAAGMDGILVNTFHWDQPTMDRAAQQVYGLDPSRLRVIADGDLGRILNQGHPQGATS